MFQSLHFHNHPQFVTIASNAAAMRYGDAGYPVRLVQQGLIDLGQKLPRSTDKYRSPDGIFGNETRNAVTKLQSKLGLADDGVVGTKTVSIVDPKLAAVPGGFAPPPALPVTAPGASGDPAVKLRDFALRVIGIGSAIFKRDSVDISWKPRPTANALQFRVSTFLDFGVSLHDCISDGRLKFRYLKREKAGASAEYYPVTVKRHGATIRANTMLLLKENHLSEHLVIHELTHAVLDFERAPRNALFNEMICYIVQALFWREKFGLYGGVAVPTGTSVHEEAAKCAFYVQMNTPIPQSKLDALAKSISALPAYRGIRRQTYINNGIN